ncbi:MAG: acylphosphatase [Candidatus Kerfeldbacteria bacterium]|nr:acylphosphatase [Candidatus Kerfeldbacteria bacterium]
MERRLTAVIRGIVQGVSLRWRVTRQAQSLGLRGFIRNEPDGSVRLVAEGPERDLQALLDWLARPKHAWDVHEVKLKWSSSRHDFTDFTVQW